MSSLAEPPRRGVLARLFAQTRDLPVAHALASFVVVAAAAAVVSTPLLARDGAPTMSSDQAIGQLVLRPVTMSGASSVQEFRDAQRLVGEGRIGGLVLMQDGHDTPNATVVRKQIARLDVSARAHRRPTPLVVLAVEGVATARSGGDRHYCAHYARVSSALHKALESTRSKDLETRVRVLARRVAGYGANALLAGDFGEAGGSSAGPCSKIDTIPLIDFVTRLRAHHVELFARGAQDPQGTPKALAEYRRAGDALALLTLSSRTAGRGSTEAPWQDRDAVSRIRRQLDSRTREILIASPDLSQEPVDAVHVALTNGADLALSTSLPGDDLAREIATYFRAHPDRLHESCSRMLAFKEDVLHSARGERCPGG